MVTMTIPPRRRSASVSPSLFPALARAAAAATCMLAGAARAADIDRFGVDIAGTGFFGSPSPALPAAWTAPFGVAVDWANDPLVLRVGGERISAVGGDAGERGDGLVERRIGLEAHAGLALGRRYFLGLALPAVGGQAGWDPASLVGPSPDPSPVRAASMGDLRLEGRWLLLEPANGAVPALALRVPVGLPTGAASALAGAAGPWVVPTLVAGWGGATHGTKSPARLALSVGWRAGPEEQVLGSAVGGSGPAVSAAGGFALTAAVEAVAEVDGQYAGPSLVDRAMEARAGLRIALAPGAVLAIGGGTGLGRAPGVPDWRLIVGLAAAPNFDASDRDADGDGIANALDACRSAPEDRDGFHDDDGCPDADNDGDGISDDADRCPDQAEDRDGFQDDDGCPDADNDGDGISDDADRCPDQAEIFNEFEDEDGCPDVHRVAVERERLRIEERIFFDFGKATIQERSQSLLDEVARVLQEHPEIARLRIQGHTDDRGSDEFNLELSQARASAVLEALVERGVARERLEAVGYGESRPVASNDTEEGRARNRRVEFRILERQQPGDGGNR